MKKFLLLLAGAIMMCGCEPDETTFRKWHYDNCLCNLSHMPSFTNDFLDNQHKINAFCRLSTDFCLTDKSKIQIKQDARFMRRVGKFQCKHDYLDKVQNKSKKYNFKPMCWKDIKEMEYRAKLANLVISCETTYGLFTNVNCDCVVKKYIGSLSYEERTELLKVGLVFPGYGWMVNTPRKQDITLSVMNKMHEAVFKCKSQ